MNFKTQKELKLHIRNIINEIGLCESIKTEYPHYFITFNLLFQRHPNYIDKIRGMDDIVIRKNIVYNHNEVLLKKGDIYEDISALNKCITGKPINDLNICMRREIQPQIDSFIKNNSDKICNFCKSTDDIQVDHHEPQFIELCAMFLSENTNIPEFEEDKSHAKIFKRGDFATNWYNFHAANAKLRYLCKKCNCSREKSDIKWADIVIKNK